MSTEPNPLEGIGSSPNPLPACNAVLPDDTSHAHTCRYLLSHTPLHQCECGAAWPRP